MAEKKKGGLGKGYSSIFIDNAVGEFAENKTPVKLNINEIEPNRSQPRTRFNDEALAELADSISQHGVLQPLLVRPLADGGYQIVAGERRFRAARLAGLTELPVVVRELTDSQVAELALVENLQREDLNPLEEAAGFKRLIDEFGYTQEESSKLVGRSRPAIANSLRLLSLPEQVRTALEDGRLTAGHGRALLTIEDESVLCETAKLISERGMSVREAEKLARAVSKTPAQGKRKKKRNPYYDEVELALGEVLGRRVRITKSTKKGSLEIEFFDDDDLNKLLRIFENDEG